MPQNKFAALEEQDKDGDGEEEGGEGREKVGGEITK